MFGTITRLLQRLGAVAWSWRRVPASIPLTYEQLMLVILSSSWLMGRITSPNSGLHGLLRNIRLVFKPQGSVFVTVFCFALMEPGCVTSDAMDRRTGNTCDGVARAGIGVGSFASRWPRGEPGACCPVDCYGSRLPRPLLARPVGMQPCVTQVSVVIMKAREVGRRNMYRASRTCADAFFTRGHQLRIFININRCRRFHVTGNTQRRAPSNPQELKYPHSG